MSFVQIEVEKYCLSINYNIFRYKLPRIYKYRCFVIFS